MSDDILDGKQTFTYEWHHIPTGKVGTNKLRVHTRKEFLDTLTKWNKMNPKQEWVYSEKFNWIDAGGIR